MAGYVYAVTNKAMPGLVKIGITTRSPSVRIAELSAFTGVPVAFEELHAVKVEDHQKVERLLCEVFADKRVNPQREFFKVAPEAVVAAMRLTGQTFIEEEIPDVEEEVTDGEANEELRQRRAKRRPNLDFLALGIDVGSELEYIGTGEEGERIVATVASARKVHYDGKEMFLTNATEEVTGQAGIRGTAYWKYKGENLVDIYERAHPREDADS